MVHRQEVDRGGDRGLILRSQERREAVVCIERVDGVGIAAQQDRIEEQAVAVGVVARGRGEVLRPFGRRQDVGHDVRDAQPEPGPLGTDRAYREPVGEVQMVGRRHGVAQVPPPGGVDAALVAQERLAPGLVEGDPVLREVAQRPDRPGGEVREARRSVPARPAARVLQDLRQLPVVERHERAHAGLPEARQERAVEGDAVRVQRAAPVWLEARPGHRQPVRGEASSRMSSTSSGQRW